MVSDGYANPIQRPALPARPEQENGSQVRLAQALLEASDTLARRAMDAMYRDPFWDARFGERGRARALDDGLYHVSYLAHALWFYTPTVMAVYARWLQGVLTPRGMCSRHIEQNFDRLGDAIEAEGIPNNEPVRSYLQAGKDGLRYPSGPARALQDAAPVLAERLALVLPPMGPRIEPGWTGDPLYVLAYLADAVALDRVDVFAAHVLWMAGFLRSRNEPAGELERLLEAMGEEMRVLPREAGEAAASSLRSALHLLRTQE
jgi:hypothetical protein